MDRQELLYAGAVLLPGDDEPTPGVELWAANRTVAAFTAGAVGPPLDVLHDVELSFNDVGYLVVAGTEGTITAAQLPQPRLAWQGLTATFPDGRVVKAVTVQESTCGVTLSGSISEVMPGARTYVVGGRKFIAPFGSTESDFIDLTSPRKAGCGGCGS